MVLRVHEGIRVASGQMEKAQDTGGEAITQTSRLAGIDGAYSVQIEPVMIVIGDALITFSGQIPLREVSKNFVMDNEIRLSWSKADKPEEARIQDCQGVIWRRG